MTWVGWVLIGLAVIVFIFLIFGLMIASGNYSRRCEDEEYYRWVERMKQKEAEQKKEDDSSWF